MAVIGDVVGKGARAAALTALARYTLRAGGAVGERQPSELLSLLNDVILADPSPHRLCTVACAVLGEGGARVDVASAGHPLPILVRSGGEIERVGRPGTMLGVLAQPWLFDEAVTLEPGDALVFFTDGVSEARTASGLLGHERVAALLAGCSGRSADHIAARLERMVLEVQEGEPRDDVAILVVRREGLRSPRRRDQRTAPHPQEATATP